MQEEGGAVALHHSRAEQHMPVHLTCISSGVEQKHLVVCAACWQLDCRLQHHRQVRAAVRVHQLALHSSEVAVGILVNQNSTFSRGRVYRVIFLLVGHWFAVNVVH